MTENEKPQGYTKQTIDNNTLNRFKILSGEKPVARYLRELSIKLSSDCPPSFEDLQGGESLTPIRMQLKDITQKLNWVMSRIKGINDLQESMDDALLLRKEGSAYDKDVKAGLRKREADHIRDDEFIKASKESPEMQEWQQRIEDDEPHSAVSPGFVWGEDGHIARRKDGTPEISPPIFGVVLPDVPDKTKKGKKKKE